MKRSIDELKVIFPYPSEKPSGVGRNYFDSMPKGWCHFVNVEMFKELIRGIKKPEMILVDGGTWMGLSAWHLLVNSQADSTVICMDTWAGSREHAQEAYRNDLKRLYDTFVINMWDYRSRIVPMKFDSVEGMRELKRLGIEPDLIYIDWSHEYEDVYDDVSTALALFPKAVICGDDLGWEGVRRALDRIGTECNGMGLKVISHKCSDGKGGMMDICWHIAR